MVELINSKNLTADVYINATTIGYNNDNPLDDLPLPENTRLVIDLNYAITETLLIASAKEKQIEAYDGKKMLFYQAVDAFEIWTGQEINRIETYNHFRRAING